MPLELYAKDLESLDESIRGFYVERIDGNGNADGFKLDVVGGAVPSAHVDALQAQRVAMEAKLKAFGNRKPEDFDVLNGKIDELNTQISNTNTKQHKDLEATLKPLREEWAQKESDFKAREAYLESEIEKRDIDNEVARVGIAAGVIPEAISDVTSRIRQVFIMEEGKATPKDENGVTMLDSEFEYRDNSPGFRATATWNVMGNIGHWVHLHTRANQYVAELGIEPVDKAWKIVSLQITDEVNLGATPVNE